MSTAFCRSFPVTVLRQWYRDPDNQRSDVHELFERWAHPGEKSDEQRDLRLAVRGGYLNFYKQGQSVAKLSVPAGCGPKIEVHERYLGGGGDRYVTLSGEDLFSLPDKSIAKRVAHAEAFSGAEKRFVDELCAATRALSILR